MAEFQIDVHDKLFQEAILTKNIDIQPTTLEIKVEDVILYREYDLITKKATGAWVKCKVIDTSDVVTPCCNTQTYSKIFTLLTLEIID